MAQDVSKRAIAALVKVGAIALFVWFTNDGVWERVFLLVGQERLRSLALFTMVWASAFGSLLIIAFHPDVRWRAGWAALVAGSTFAGYVFMRVGGAQLTMFHAATLWTAVADTGRAVAFYAPDVAIAGFAALAGFAILTSPPPDLGRFATRVLRLAIVLPVLPVMALSGLILYRIGNDTTGMPQQFTPMAIAGAAAFRLSAYEQPDRKSVATGPEHRAAARHVLFLMDESISADTVSVTEPSRTTPYLHSIRDRIADFGTASSTGNCSASSNAIIRMGGAQFDLRATVKSTPFVWDYARKAGFRTVFIDAGASHIKTPTTLQNYMTLGEKRKIDEFITIGDGPAHQLDRRLADRIAEILARPEPHFIYANKNGAHFPYFHAYPEEATVFRPAEGETGGDVTQQARENAYRNAVRWSVDEFFRYFVGRVSLEDTVLVYSSDHGQNRTIGRLTHCSAVQADPFEGEVPLFVMTGIPDLLARFSDAARINRDRTTQFAVFPTLLSLFGYDRSRLAPGYGGGLLERASEPQRFVSGDLFGIFGRGLEWNEIRSPETPLVSVSGVGG